MLAGFAWLRVAGCSRFGWVVWGGLRTYTALATAALASAATRPHPSSQRRQGWPIGRKEKGQSRVWPLNGGGTWRLPLRQEPPQPFGHGGEINSSGLPCLVGVDLRATGFVLVQVELLEQLALPNQQVGQPAFMLE